MAFAGIEDLDDQTTGTDLGPATAPPPTGPTGPSGPTAPSPQPARVNAQLILRVDAAALKRGHTLSGELCEIAGIGPVPVAALREFLPDAAIAVVVQDGIDAFNVTNLSRRASVTQQIVQHLLNIGCTRLGCPATEHLQLDHRVDWHKIHVTELQNLDWLCPHDHRLKTHKGWQLEPGTGKRTMYPPGQQAWLVTDSEPAPPGAPPGHAAA